MSNLQDISNILFMSMTGPKVAQRIQVVSILLHEAKTMLGIFCLHLNVIGWSGHVQEYSAKKRGVGTPFPHQIKRKAAPNNLNKVSICLQKLLHTIFLFHCRFWLAVRTCMLLAHLWDRSPALMWSFRSHIFKYRY